MSLSFHLRDKSTPTHISWILHLAAAATHSRHRYMTNVFSARRKQFRCGLLGFYAFCRLLNEFYWHAMDGKTVKDASATVVNVADLMCHRMGEHRPIHSFLLFRLKCSFFCGNFEGSEWFQQSNKPHWYRMLQQFRVNLHSIHVQTSDALPAMLSDWKSQMIQKCFKNLFFVLWFRLCIRRTRFSVQSFFFVDVHFKFQVPFKW